MNVRLEYWNGTEWVACSSFQNERIAWLSLGGDDLNYRTIDTTKPVLTVLTDRKAPIPLKEQQELDTTFSQETNSE